MHHLNAALRANHLYHRDQHYVVQDGEIVIVDEFTGRLMTGRRWSDGLHQAVEAKEGVEIQAENQTLASITFQNYFRLYNKLAGMTGTADTEAYEFQEIYGLETMVIPPNRPSRRDDQLDRVYKTTREKYEAAIKDIRECHERGQPVLVGTTVDRELRDHRPAARTRKACRTRCSTPSSTPARPTSWPRPGAEDDHDRHQHGGARHRHRARRQRRERRSRPSRPTSRSTKRPSRRDIAELRAALDQGPREGQGRWAACASSPPSAMSRAASTTSCAAVRAARATRARRAST